jgi:hypothetical protein
MQLNFGLEFTFAENPYFTNNVLRKLYKLKYDEHGEFQIEHVEWYVSANMIHRDNRYRQAAIRSTHTWLAHILSDLIAIDWSMHCFVI